MKYLRYEFYVALAFYALLGSSYLSSAEMREFKDVTGRPLEASFLSRTGDNVTLLLKSGKTAVVPLARLSPADQNFIAEEEKKSAGASEAINQAFGFSAFSRDQMTSRNAEEMAKAMKLPLESDSPIGKSWRLYAAVSVKNYRLLGTMPFSVALYSNSEGMADSLSIIFANKGDYGSSAGFAQDHFKNNGAEKKITTLEDAMTYDAEQITQKLTQALGKGVEQRFGDSGSRRNVTRWDWNNHSFLLSHVEGEYVSVLVVPTDRAETGGRSDVKSDKEVLERTQKSVKREANGDVWISGIPMVDQGPKGYCVPATFERAMRYMGLETDMYLLAMIGETSAGGGTSVFLLMENLRSQVYRKGRRLKEQDIKKLRIQDVKREIDSGVPFLWRMCSTEKYNEFCDTNSEKRHKAEHAAWLTQVRTEVEKKMKPDHNHHLCMIIGYNETTGELAVSDSWGEEFKLRWVPVEVANWVSNGALVSIQP